VWSERAIVGTPETQTPMFRDNIDHLVFNPTWSVPTSIQKKMARVGGDFKVVDRSTGRAVTRGNPRDYSRYRLVQQPGPRNALGRVKFMFPNRHAIYLHDTAAKGLFGRTTRALSNGCVRVQDPLALAEQILGPQGWARDSIDRVVERGTMRYVHLEQTLPVLLYYLTAFADAAGEVSVRRDIYGRDPALFAALAQPLRHARIALPEPEAPAETISVPPAADQTPTAPMPPSASGDGVHDAVGAPIQSG
jgi:murein L,D-transpeptidase YcbB/YkuD